MSHNNDDAQHPKPPKESLLEELELIQGLLNDRRGTTLNDDFNLDIDIPILEDVVIPDQPDNSSQSSLLNLQSIFDEDSNEETIKPLEPNPLLAAQPEPESKWLDQTKDNLEQPTDTTSESPATSFSKLDFAHLDTDIEIPSFRLESTLVTTDATYSTQISTAASENLDESYPWSNNPPPTPDSNDIELATNSELESLELESEETHIHYADKDHFTQNKTTVAEDSINVDLLIQEIVDELIPDIEHELRQRLSQYSPDVILELAEKYLDS